MSVRYITVFTVILATWLAVSPVLADNVTFFSQSLILLAKNEDQPLKGNDPSRESPASENSAHTDGEPGKSCSNHDQTGHGCTPAQPPAETVSLPQDVVSPDPVQPPSPPTSVQIVPEPDPVQITPEPGPVPVIPEPEFVQIIPEIEELPITSEVESTEIEPAQVISEPAQTVPEAEVVPTTSEVELIQTEETEPAQTAPEIEVVPTTSEVELIQTEETEPAQTAPEIEVVPTTSEVELIRTEETEPVQIIPEIKIVPATPEAETVQITPQTEPAQTIPEAEEEVSVTSEVEPIQTEETEPVQPILPQPIAVPNPVINTVICSEGPLLTATCVGQQRLFNNLTVAAGASVSEIILNGTITNQGWISNATILAGSTVTGGTLTGSIFNEGTVNDITFKGSKLSGGYVGGVIGIAQKGAVLENVTVLQDTQLDGGTLINAQIMDGVTLTNVTLGQGTQFSENVIIGQEVRFVDNAQIPVGTNLTAAFSTRFTPEMPKLLDLHIEVLDGPVPTLLQQINQIPELQANQWQFEQNPWNGQLQLDINGVRFALLPVQVTQVAADQAVGMTVNPDDSIRFVTSYGREILAQPMIQDLEAFRLALGLEKEAVQITPEGVVQVKVSEDSWNAYRASVESNLVGEEQSLGLFDAPGRLILTCQRNFRILNSTIKFFLVPTQKLEYRGRRTNIAGT